MIHEALLIFKFNNSEFFKFSDDYTSDFKWMPL